MAANHIDIKTVALAAAVILGVETGLHLAARLETVSPVALIGAARIIEGLLLLILVRKWCSGGLAAIGLSVRGIVPGFKKGVIWSVGFGILVAIVSLAAFLFAGINALEHMRTGNTASIGTLLLFFTVGGIVSPVTEEIVFRGILYGYLRRWGFGTALIFSSLLFVLAHAAGGGFPLAQTVGGVLFALAYEKERNLVVPMVIHILGNLAIFAVTLF